jgi:formiminotetrahydrofolate cyclodeaminase
MNDGYSQVLSSIASSDPTPGGGSVAALSLAHAQSLAIMVSRLTLGKQYRNWLFRTQKSVLRTL